MSRHSNRAHALLSASGAHRWMNCTPSARLCEDLPDQSSEASLEGTHAHEIAESYLRRWLATYDAATNTYGTVDVSQEDDETKVFLFYLEPYLSKIKEECRMMKAIDKDAVALAECKVSFDAYAKEGFGTADFILVGNNTIKVFDLKYGVGVKVEAPDNPQPRLYALGALNKFEPLLGKIDNVETYIIQPRLNHMSTEKMKTCELKKWARTKVKPKAEKAYNGKGKMVAGEWCQFCKGKGICPLQLKKNLGQMKAIMSKASKEPELLTPEEISAVLPIARDCNSWIKKLEEQAKNIAESAEGDGIPGYELTNRNGKRIWTNEKAVEQILLDAGFKGSQIITRKLKSPKQIEEIIENTTILDNNFDLSVIDELNKYVARGNSSLILEDSDGYEE